MNHKQNKNMLYFADLEQQIIDSSVRTALVASAVLIIAAIIAVTADKGMKKKSYKKIKAPLFVVMAATIAVSTLILTYNTVYINVVSESNGPVHWHTDIELWACDSELELRDPTGFLSNKIGTSTYHEHNDKRIHLEGVVVEKRVDASLGKFMEVTGGGIGQDWVNVPLGDNPSSWLASQEHQDGDPQSLDFKDNINNYVGQDPEGQNVLRLNDGSLACGMKKGEVQVFVYEFDNDTESYSQSKLSDPAAYVMADESIVPPGDCVIVEFDEPKTETDKLCTQYGVKDSERCTDFGVESYDPKLCKYRYEGVRDN